MSTVSLRMKALMDLRIPSVVQVDDQSAAMKINSEWDLKVTVLEKSIIYEARSKGKSYNPKKDAGIPADVKGVIEAFEEKYTGALLELLEGEECDPGEPENKDPLDNLKAGGFDLSGTQAEEPEKPQVVDSTPKETPKKEQWKTPPKQHAGKLETNTEEIRDATFEEVDPGELPNLPAPVGIAGIVRPAVSAREALAAWKEFQELKKYIIEPSDIQEVSTFDKKTGTYIKKNWVKKSGWRKFATFYNLTDRIVEERKEPIGTGGFLWKIKVVCTAPNGRETEGVGMCSSTERGFAHPDHDIYATAHTRAKNRAISDMIAAGEISAEEVMDGGMTV